MSLWPVYKLTFYLLYLTRRHVYSCYVRLLFYPIYLLLVYFPARNAECIGVASMGHWGRGTYVPVATLDFHLIFCVTSEPHKLSLFHWTLYVVAYPGKKYTSL